MQRDDKPFDGWWADYFDEAYLRIYEPLLPPAETDREVAAIRELLEERGVERILDVPCGWGRHSIELARIGFGVTGVDASEFLLEEARRRAADAGVALRLIHADMRRLPFSHEFDAAICLSSSLGYFGGPADPEASEDVRGDEESRSGAADFSSADASSAADAFSVGDHPPGADASTSAEDFPGVDEALGVDFPNGGSEAGDLAVLSAIRSALLPGGVLLIETTHRDAVARDYAERDWWESPSGDTVWVERDFDPIAGISYEVLRWRDEAGGEGEKRHAIRIRAASEWAALLARAGFRPLEWYGDWSLEPFTLASERLIVLCEAA